MEYHIHHTAEVSTLSSTKFHALTKNGPYIDAHFGPLTNPLDLSRLRVRRIMMRGRARIRSPDLEAGSHKKPEDSSSDVIPIFNMAASQTSEAP